MLDKNGFDITLHSSIPKEWFDEVEGARFFGKPIMDYNIEELAAIAIHGWKLFQDAQFKKRTL